MRDITTRRARLDRLRAELNDAWRSPDANLERIARITGQLRAVLNEKPEMDLIDDASGQTLRRAISRARLTPMGVNSDHPDEPPSAHQVAVAVVAACKETGADPVAVISGEICRGGSHGLYSLPRARAYAALAIRAVFPNNGNTAIGRWVGASSWSSYVGGLDHRLKNKTLTWWDDAVFMRVVAALEATLPSEVA